MELSRRPLNTLPPLPAGPVRAWPAGARHYGYQHGRGRPPGVGDFVNGGFPLPSRPVFDGMGEFVGGSYPLPQNPVYYASAEGSLPKAPDIPMALIANGNGKCAGMGCGCSDCGGLGDMAVPTWATSLPSPLNSTQWGYPVVYLLGAAAIGYFMFMKKGR